MAALRLPSSLKLGHLKTLCIACGLPSSGTKQVLSGRLEEAACSVGKAHHGRNRADRRILSIDLGIRNLAFCLLAPRQFSSPVKLTSSAGVHNGDPHTLPPIELHAWRRADIAPPIATFPVSSHPGTATSADAWSPASMANLTLDLVCQQLLPLKPTHILIERQRFRSGGAAAVQEWTLRVNTLEAMMHAVLRTLAIAGKAEVNVEVASVAPGRVGAFWVGDGDGNGEGRKGAKTRIKGAKIDLIGKWLEGIDMKGIGSQEAERTAEAYLERWHGSKGRRKKENGHDGIERFRKLDDLADCLLQGMAWIRWEENTRILASQGAEVLLGKM